MLESDCGAVKPARHCGARVVEDHRAGAINLPRAIEECRSAGAASPSLVRLPMAIGLDGSSE
jgi:hypothetical protein